MDGRDRCLQLVGAGPTETNCPLQDAAALLDASRVPERPVLILEQDELAVGAGAGLTPRVVEEHQREQPENLRLVRHQDRDQLAEANRLVAELAPDQIVARSRGVALVEDEIENREHRLEPIGELLVRRERGTGFRPA